MGTMRNRLVSTAKGAEALLALRRKLRQKDDDAKPLARSGARRGRDVDRDLFIPMMRFFRRDRLLPRRLVMGLLRSGIPDSKISDETGLTGFLLEAYVKDALSRFERIRRCFSLNRTAGGSLGDDYTYRTDSGLGVTFIETSGERRIVAEIDTLGEYSPSHSRKRPVIFEVKSASLKRHNNRQKAQTLSVMRKRMELIERMYGAEPYLCLIRPAANGERPELRKNERDGLGILRSILIPSYKHMGSLATLLGDGFPQSGWAAKLDMKVRVIAALASGLRTTDEVAAVTESDGSSAQEVLEGLWWDGFLDMQARDEGAVFLLSEKGRGIAHVFGISRRRRR